MKQQLIESFEKGMLPKAEWTHHAHLKVGLWYILNLELGDAVIKMRQNVCHYNECVGTMNTDTTGYHETITIVWLMLIKKFMAEHPIRDFDILAEVLINSSYANPQLPLAYYTKETLMSVTARKQWVEPDIAGF